MSIATPKTVTRRWHATGKSMNGKLDYEIVVEAVLEAAARELLREYVIQYVRRTYGVTPRGVGWLVDPRTVCVRDADTDPADNTKEVAK